MNRIWLEVRQYGCSVADLYQQERNHQGKDNLLLFPFSAHRERGSEGAIRCRERLGGLLGTQIYSRAE
jgi:hypothetical protein